MMYLLQPTIAINRSKRVQGVSAIYLLLLLQVLQVFQVGFAHNQFNSSRSNHNGFNYGPVRFYRNHRMLSEDFEERRDSRIQQASSSNQTGQVDNSADSSMPQPQLALQIFTSPPLNRSPHLKPQQQQINSSANHRDEQSARLLNSMLLMPVSSLMTAQNHRQSSDLEPNSGTPSASQRNYMIDLGSQQSKPSQWHYVTEGQQDSAPESRASREHTNIPDVIGGGSSPPVINAIITVPAQSEHHHHHHHQNQQNQQDREPDKHLSRNGSTDNRVAAQLVDRTIAQLLDGQTTGNIEFSLDLNGEDIVINPVRKNGRSIEPTAGNGTRESLLNKVINKLEPLISSDVDKQEDPIQLALGSRRLKSLIDSDDRYPLVFKRTNHEPIENQQSASEIDMVDENTSDDDGESSSADGETFVEPSGKSSRKSDSESKSAIDRDSDKFDEERSSAISSAGGSADDLGDNRGLESGETTGEELNKPLDSEPGRVSSKTKTRLRTLVGRKQQSRDFGQKMAQASRRRVTLKSDEPTNSHDQQPAVNRRETKQVTSTREPGMSAVMIKGDDLKRLEHLLESLRSASLSDTRIQRQKQRSTGYQGQRRDYSAEDGTNFKREETEPRTTHQTEGETWHEQNKSRQQAKGAQIDSKSDKNELITLSDCDRRKLQKQMRRVATSDDDNNSYESDSTQELSTEVNEDGSEKEEQGSDNYNSISLPLRDRQDQEQPRSLFVRKTILQSYYDDNQREPNTERIVDKDLASSYESNDEHVSDRGNVDALIPTQEASTQNVRSYSATSNSKLLRNESSPRSRNYIDYSRLDDRDVYRGLPSAAGNRTY